MKTSTSYTSSLRSRLLTSLLRLSWLTRQAGSMSTSTLFSTTSSQTSLVMVMSAICQLLKQLPLSSVKPQSSCKTSLKSWARSTDKHPTMGTLLALFSLATESSFSVSLSMDVKPRPASTRTRRSLSRNFTGLRKKSSRSSTGTWCQEGGGSEPQTLSGNQPTEEVNYSDSDDLFKSVENVSNQSVSWLTYLIVKKRA